MSLDATGVAVGGNRTGVELVRRIVRTVVNDGDLGAVPDLFAADYVLRKAGLSVPRGPEAIKMLVRQWRDAFPDYHVEIEAVIAAGDVVACRYVASGTHRGALLGVPPTDRTFTVRGTDVHRLADGLVAESWLADDLPRILTEVGFLTPSASSRWT